jgi:hypothetical protein
MRRRGRGGYRLGAPCSVVDIAVRGGEKSILHPYTCTKVQITTPKCNTVQHTPLRLAKPFRFQPYPCFVVVSDLVPVLTDINPGHRRVNIHDASVRMWQERPGHRRHAPCRLFDGARRNRLLPVQAQLPPRLPMSPKQRSLTHGERKEVNLECFFSNDNTDLEWARLINNLYFSSAEIYYRYESYYFSGFWH